MKQKSQRHMLVESVLFLKKAFPEAPVIGFLVCVSNSVTLDQHCPTEIQSKPQMETTYISLNFLQPHLKSKRDLKNNFNNTLHEPKIYRILFQRVINILKIKLFPLFTFFLHCLQIQCISQLKIATLQVLSSRMSLYWIGKEACDIVIEQECIFGLCHGS